MCNIVQRLCRLYVMPRKPSRFLRGKTITRFSEWKRTHPIQKSRKHSENLRLFITQVSSVSTCGAYFGIDKNTDPNEKENAESKFKDINEAYAILSDPEKKRRYDSGADEMSGMDMGFGDGAHVDVNDIMNMFMGGGGGGFGGGGFAFSGHPGFGGAGHGSRSHGGFPF